MQVNAKNLGGGKEQNDKIYLFATHSVIKNSSQNLLLHLISCDTQKKT